MKTTSSAMLAYVLDWETGGLDPVTCAVTQLSVHAVNLCTFERIGTFMRYITPYNRRSDVGASKNKKVLKSKYDDGTTNIPMEYNPKALEVQGATMDMLYEKGIPLADMVNELLAWMDEMMPEKTSKSNLPLLVGQNIAFDEGFLSQVIEYTGTLAEFKKRMRGKEDFYGNWHPVMVDTIVMGQFAMCHNPEITSYKLELMCERLGIELVDAHDADADVEATEAVMVLLANRMRSEGGVQTGELPDNSKEKRRDHFKI